MDNLPEGTKVQLHHVFSDKSPDILTHKIFKDGALDRSILNDPRNLMLLPTKEGMHPTMNTHSGRHLAIHNEKMADILTSIYQKYQAGKITKNQITSEYWKAVMDEKQSLFNGKSNLHKKDFIQNGGQ